MSHSVLLAASNAAALAGCQGRFANLSVGVRIDLHIGDIIAVAAVGLTPRTRCNHFRPRAYAFRLQRQRQRHLGVTACSASAAAQTLPGPQPKPLPQAALVALALWQRMLQQIAACFQRAVPLETGTDVSRAKHNNIPVAARQCVCDKISSQYQIVVQDINAGIRSSVRHMRCLMAVAPFAAATGSASTFLLITKAVGSFIKVTAESFHYL